MKVNFLVQYPINLFETLDSVSRWSIHCRRSERKNSFDVFKAVKNDLKEYKKIRRKNSWGSDFQSVFASKSMSLVYKKLEKKREWKKIIPIIKKADNVYKKKWGKRKKILEAHKTLIELSIKKEHFDDIVCFLDLKKAQDTNVFLIFRGSGSGGGANYKQGITLEVGGVRNSTASYTGVLLHELMHYFESVNKRKTRNWFKEKGVGKETAQILEEALFDCIVPDGLLAYKFRLIRKNPVKTIEKKYKFRSRYEKKRYKLYFNLMPIVFKYWKNRKRRKYENLLKQVLKEHKSWGFE